MPEWFPSKDQLLMLANFTKVNSEVAHYLADCVQDTFGKQYPAVASEFRRYADNVEAELFGPCDSSRAWNGERLPQKQASAILGSLDQLSGANVHVTNSIEVGLRVTIDQNGGLDRAYEPVANQELSSDDTAYLDGCFLAWIAQNRMYREGGLMYEMNDTEDGPKKDASGQKILVDPDTLLKKCQDPQDGLVPYFFEASQNRFAVAPFHAERVVLSKQIEQ